MTESLPPIQAKAVEKLMAARQPRTPAASRSDPRDADSEPPPAIASESSDPDPATDDDPAEPEPEPESDGHRGDPA